MKTVDEKHLKKVWYQIFNNMPATDASILKFHLDELIYEYSTTCSLEEVELMKNILKERSEEAQNWMNTKTQPTKTL